MVRQSSPAFQMMNRHVRMAVGDVRRAIVNGFKSDRERWLPFIAKVYSETKAEWDHGIAVQKRSYKRVRRMLPTLLEEGKKLMKQAVLSPVVESNRTRPVPMQSPNGTSSMMNLLQTFSPSDYQMSTPTRGRLSQASTTDYSSESCNSLVWGRRFTS